MRQSRSPRIPKKKQSTRSLTTSYTSGGLKSSSPSPLQSGCTTRFFQSRGREAKGNFRLHMESVCDLGRARSSGGHFVIVGLITERMHSLPREINKYRLLQLFCQGRCAPEENSLERVGCMERRTRMRE